MLVRKANLEDIYRVYSIISEVIGTHPLLSEQSRQHQLRGTSWERLEAELRKAEPLILVCEVEGIVQGVVTLTLEPGGVLYIVWICVPPDARRLGAGPSLLQGTLDEARKRGCHAVAGHTLAKNRGISRYVERIGFKAVGRLNNHWFNEDYIFWQYQLNSRQG